MNANFMDVWTNDTNLPYFAVVGFGVSPQATLTVRQQLSVDLFGVAPFNMVGT
jgi:hypothetical protein